MPAMGVTMVPVLVAVRRGNSCVQPSPDRGQSGARLADGHTGFQTRIDGQDGVLLVPRHVNIGRIAEADQRTIIGRQNANHRVRTPIQAQRAADYRGIAAQTRAPEMVA